MPSECKIFSNCLEMFVALNGTISTLLLPNRDDLNADVVVDGLLVWVRSVGNSSNAAGSSDPGRTVPPSYS